MEDKQLGSADARSIGNNSQDNNYPEARKKNHLSLLSATSSED